MSRQKLKRQLKEKNPKLNNSELETILDSFTSFIIQALINKQECEIRDFGSFRLSKLNELIYRPERVKLKFKASKKINKLINEWKNLYS